ncbi:cytochrome c [Oleiagrimonas sp. C23AA]|uniref:c-type cytochrome n=1 Tax=Oleiagrimonas sp. C23AA TaxID=2719047 RepID=UPI00141DE532|nr:cytochrome c [Oleiagrimonas sp. C23AA]NII11199.1 cytochrome c [Oleiagrimonas sp. C23AA]
MKPGRILTTTLPALGLLASTMAWASPPPTSGDAQAGSAVYHQTCVACHGENGKGQIPGTPDFTKSGGVLSLPTKVLQDRIVHGFQSNGSPMAMPPNGGNPTLTPKDVDNVIAYLRKTFGH